MQKIGASTNTANPSGEFTEGNPAAGIAATLLRAPWLNAIQRELVHLVEAAGLTLDAADDSQILKAIQTIQERANSWLKLADKPTTVAGFGITDVFTKAETTTAIQQKVAALVDSSPAALDTLRELAAALGNDPNFATTMTNALAAKANKATTLGGYGITDGATRGDINSAVSNLLPKDGGRMTGTIVLNNGSTDSPEISWQTPDIDIRADVVGKALRFFAVSGGETTYPLMMYTNEKLVTMFGNAAWHAGNFNPSECIKKGQVLNPGESPKCISAATGAIGGISGDAGALEVRGNGSGAALISFHRPGFFGTHLGIDTDNQLKVGGWSMGGVAHTLFHSGNFDPNTYLTRVGIQGASKNLNGWASGLNTVATYTADELIVGNASGTYRTLRGVNVSPSLAGAGANGLDVGVSAPNAWYSAWVIWNGSGAAGLFSLSATAPTLPAGFTHLARVGWVRSDGSRNLVSFIQTGKSWRYKSFGSTTNVVAPTLAAGQAGDPGGPTWAAVSVSHAVPPTASQILVITNSLAAGGALVVHPNPFGGNYQNRTNPPSIAQSVSPTTGGSSTLTALLTLESTNIYWANNAASSFLVCLGFEDNF